MTREHAYKYRFKYSEVLAEEFLPPPDGSQVDPDEGVPDLPDGMTLWPNDGRPRDSYGYVDTPRRRYLVFAGWFIVTDPATGDRWVETRDYFMSRFTAIIEQPTESSDKQITHETL